MYAIMYAACALCGRPFGFNPNLVPSIRKTPGGPKEPVCSGCHERANQIRVENGLEPWPPPMPGAYEGADEDEIRWDG